MESICLRTPHILEQINELLDNKSLVKCKGASRITCSNIENQKCGKFMTTRTIQSYVMNPKEFENHWKMIIQKLPMERLSEFGMLVKDFYKVSPSRFQENWAPMHIAADRGRLDFCIFIAKVSASQRYKLSPLLFSAQAGHLEVSKFLYKEIEDKTSKTRSFQLTAQHLAAKNGHLEIYKFLHENTHDINPVMQKMITPLHLAAQFGQIDVCKYICDNTVLVKPHRSDSLTPLHLAVHRGHFKVARLLMERDDEDIQMTTLEATVITFVFVIIYLFIIFMNICIFVDICLYYPLSGESRSFFEPIEFIKMTTCLTFFAFTLRYFCLSLDVWFSFKISPKLKY